MWVAVWIERVLAYGTQEQKNECGTNGEKCKNIAPERAGYGDLDGTENFRIDMAPVSYTHLTLPTIYSV